MTDNEIIEMIRICLNGSDVDAPISRAELVRCVNAPDRRVRKIIELYMPDVGSCSNPGGYYTIRTKADCDRAMAEHISRGKKEFARARRIGERFGSGVPALPWVVFPADRFLPKDVSMPDFLRRAT